MCPEESKTEAAIRPDPILVKAEVPSPTGMMRVYFSSYHLWAAEHFVKLASDIENSPGERPRFDIQHRAYVTSAIFSAVAFLEAAINELCEDVVDGHVSYIAPIDKDARKLITVFWRLTEGRNRSPFSILDKYQIILTSCRKDQFATGAQPYQDADLVIKLRNVLMHYKPQTYGGEVQHKFIKQLAGKFPENPLMAGSSNPYFPDKCLGSGCAGWAIRSTRKLADEFFEKLGITPNYQRVKF